MAQFARPSADISVGGWTETPLWEKLDEVTANDETTEIASGNNPTTNGFEVRVTGITDPDDNTGHVARVRVKKSANAGRTINFTFTLVQGATTIATWSANNVTGSYATFAHSLTEGEAGNITDYSDLRIRVSANNPDTGPGRQGLCTWIELEAPDAAAGPITGSGSGVFGSLTGAGSGSTVIAAAGVGLFAALVGAGAGAGVVAGAGSGDFPALTGSGEGAAPVELTTTIRLYAGDTEVASWEREPSESLATEEIALTETQVQAIRAEGAWDDLRLEFDPVGPASERLRVTWAELEAPEDAGIVAGSGSGTLAALEGAGTGTVAVSGAGDGLLPALTGSGDGAAAVAGSGTGTLPALTGSGTGTTEDAITGSGSGTFPALTGSGAGAVAISGAGAGTLPSLEGSGTGATEITGSGTGTFAPLTGSGFGTTEDTITGSGAGDFPALTGSGTGAAVVSGEGSGALPAPEGTGQGQAEVTGSGSGTFAPLEGSGFGTTSDARFGSGSGTFPALTGSGSGQAGVAGSGQTALPALTGLGAGSVPVAGDGATLLPAVRGEGSGLVVVTGSGSGVFPALTGAGMESGAPKFPDPTGPVRARVIQTQPGARAVDTTGTVRIVPTTP